MKYIECTLQGSLPSKIDWKMARESSAAKAEIRRWHPMLLVLLVGYPGKLQEGIWPC